MVFDKDKATDEASQFDSSTMDSMVVLNWGRASDSISKSMPSSDSCKATDGAFQFDSSTMDPMVDLVSKVEVTSE